MTDLSPEAILADALSLPRAEIAPDISIENCASWDSMAHFRVVAAVEEAIGRPLTPEEIFNATDYASVKQLIGS